MILLTDFQAVQWQVLQKQLGLLSQKVAGLPFLNRSCCQTFRKPMIFAMFFKKSDQSRVHFWVQFALLKCSLHFESALLYEKCKLHPKVHFKSANCTQNCTIEFEETLKIIKKYHLFFKNSKKSSTIFEKMSNVF